ncbi:unnamed protein product [Rotaria sp. Silwood2]|nr:unnamed protein product [Rotaria sp. Silwood2]CAF2855939.1 unnamed protein product [Rotaria sp. Silwood2]CAF3047723.1 unnamed protein product [Rotaria sp. Silwood2]CAF3294599.1 unnamed protein product [Rotaria sp. Silwood2]CAF4053038.1 unnamed protein product [Rotaria sp. Silwood2]
MSVDVDVIIIGAGAAGIGAAIELKKTSLSFVVLEARDRIGGRAYTDRETFSSIPIDLGASWIHEYEPNNPMYLYYQKYKTDEKNSFGDDDSDDEVVNLDYDGQCLSPEVEQQAKGVCAQLFEHLEKFASENDEQEDRSVEDVIRSYYDQIVEPYGQIKRIIDSCLATFEVYEASSFPALSAKQWETIDESTICERFVLFGYGTILERIVDQYKFPIRLNTVVTHIDTCNSDRIAVCTSTADSPIFCRRIIVTIPLGCLKRETVVFKPPLPEWKRQAIDRMGFGLMNKLILQFPEQFWNAKKKIILRTCAEQRGRFLYTVCLPSPANILILLISGMYARELEHLTDTGILDQVMIFLRQIFPQLQVPNPIKTKFTRWSQDPFAFGSYSNYAVHANEQTVEMLTRETADGRVHWAGEHAHFNDDTNVWMHGCVHTAFQSGRRAALAIKDQLDSSSFSLSM